MSSYILRKINPDLWDAVKARAAREGHGVKWIVLSLLAHYAEFGLPRRPVSTANAALERLQEQMRQG